MDLSKYKGIRPLGNLLERFKNVKIKKSYTLFPPTLDMSQLKESKCPACKRPLKILRSRPLAICGRKTCPATQDRDTFRVSLSKLAQIKNG